MKRWTAFWGKSFRNASLGNGVTSLRKRINMSPLKGHNNAYISTLITFIVIFSFIGSAKASDKKIPFYPGEKLTYQAKWGVIPAGEAVIKVLPMEKVDGIETYHFAMVTETNATIDLFYKIRERQDSYTDIDLTRTILYKKLSTGKHPRDVIVNFDWGKLEATYSSFGEKMAPIHVVPDTFDPLSIFFIIRLHELKENSVIEIPVSDGKKCIVIKATVSKRETINLAGKRYDTYLVIPDMERLEDVFKKGDDPKLKIWFTADEKKIPVKIISKAEIGSFIFELISAEN